MEVPVKILGFEGRDLAVKTAGFFSGPKVLVDGRPAPKGPKRGEYLLRRNDDTEATLQLRQWNILDPVPRLTLDGEPLTIAEPLKWYQWIWGGLPFLLIIVGGFIGALFGAVGLFINGRLFRSRLRRPAQYAATAGVTVAAGAVYLAAALLFNLSVAGWLTRPTELMSVAGRFSVVPPAKLTETAQPTEMPDGSKIDLHSFSGERGDLTFQVHYIDYPVNLLLGLDPNDVLQGARGGAVESINGTLLADSQITLNGFPGREFVIDGKTETGVPVSAKIRIFLVGNRLYEVLVLSTKQNAGDTSTDDFLRSFRLLQKTE